MIRTPRSTFRRTLVVSTLALAALAAGHGSADALVAPDQDVNEFPSWLQAYIHDAYLEEDGALRIDDSVLSRQGR